MSTRPSADDPGRAALRAGTAAVTLDADVLALTGADVVPYLQTKLTADTRTWASTGGGRGIATDINGRVVASGWWVVNDGTVYAIVPKGAGAGLAEHLDRFVIMEDVALATETSLAPILLVGDTAAGHLDGHPHVDAAHGPWAARIALVPAAERADIVASTGLTETSEAALQAEEVAAGIPSDAVELAPGASIPLEAGAWDRVSFDKGCYLGQEVIERLHSRGTPARRLCRLAVNAAPGATVQTGDRSVGEIIRVADTPDGPMALGWVKRRGLADGVSLTVDGAPVTAIDVVQWGDATR